MYKICFLKFDIKYIVKNFFIKCFLCGIGIIYILVLG